MFFRASVSMGVEFRHRKLKEELEVCVGVRDISSKNFSKLFLPQLPFP